MLAGALAGVAAGGATATAAANLQVNGNRLVDHGHVVQLRGVDRSGLEYACIQNTGFFESPHPNQIDTPSMIAAMVAWDINAVRVPLNEDCWLGLHTPGRYGGANYRRIVRRYVAALHKARLYVILDLHWAGPGASPAAGQVPMADADHSPAFWHSVASTFKRDHALLFDLFNEPYQISWSCWLHGCMIPAGTGADGDRWPAYRSAGMQQLVDAVRSAGATQPLMLGGVSWSLDLSGWLEHEPRDPAGQLVASEHNYGQLAPCDPSCRGAILATHRKVPIVVGELGETDCRHEYIDRMMPFADRHGISYLGWAWDAGPYWTCTNGPSLIKAYDGTPTAFGIGFRKHFRALGTPYRPA